VCGNEATICRDGLPHSCFVRLVDSIFIFSLRDGKTKIFIKLLMSFQAFGRLAHNGRNYMRWGLRASFLSNPDTVVAGCGLCCPHGDPNWHIAAVCARHGHLVSKIPKYSRGWNAQHLWMPLKSKPDMNKDPYTRELMSRSVSKPHRVSLKL
jgi:hypothetical protein